MFPNEKSSWLRSSNFYFDAKFKKNRCVIFEVPSDAVFVSDNHVAGIGPSHHRDVPEDVPSPLKTGWKPVELRDGPQLPPSPGHSPARVGKQRNWNKLNKFSRLFKKAGQEKLKE